MSGDSKSRNVHYNPYNELYAGLDQICVKITEAIELADSIGASAEIFHTLNNALNQAEIEKGYYTVY